MRMKIFISFLACMLMGSVILGHPLEGKLRNEPMCSKFDYEEKLLEKMIRMEMKMENILQEVKDKEKDISSIATDLSQKVGSVEDSVIQFQNGVKQTMKDFDDKFKEEKAKIIAIAEKSVLPMVGFNVRLSSTKTVKTGDKVVYDTVLTNQGKGYDGSTGIFTAPHTGLYMLSAHVCNHGNKDVQYAIYHEGTQLTSSTQYDNNNVYSCSSVNTVAMINRSQQAWVQCTDTSVIYGDTVRWNTFVGSLLAN